MKRLLPPTFLMLCVAIMLLLHRFVPIFSLIPSLMGYFGSGIACFGLLISILGSNKFKKIKTTIMTFDKPSVLVKEGLFRYSRNPMYLGFLLIVIGIWMLLGSASSLAIVLLFFIRMDRYYIPFEENVLVSIFDSEYEEYKKQVRRWI